MPILFTGYQESGSDWKIDPRKPHSNLPAGRRPVALNGTKRFLDDSETSTDEDGSADGESVINNRLECRHLALCYCTRSLQDPRHVPHASDLSTLRRQNPIALEEALGLPRRLSRAFHFVCAGDFGHFLNNRFRQMERNAAPNVDTAEPVPLAQRLFLLDTGTHAMALRLTIWGKAGTEEVVHEVTVYDPNATNHHVQAMVPGLEAFTACQRDHHFFSYITPRSFAQADPWCSIGLNYFEQTQNTSWQMALYEFKEPGAGGDPGELEIDWSASPRTSYYLARHAQCDSTIRHCLAACLNEAVAHMNPVLLMELPGFDNALLPALIDLPEAEPMQQWRLVWEAADEDLKVHLLCAYNQHMSPLSFTAEPCNADRLADWVSMLQTLSPEQVLRVLGAKSPMGLNGLQLCLLSPQVLQALDPVLRQCATTHAHDIGRLLSQTDDEGCSTLATMPVDQCADGLGIWVRWLVQWVEPDLLPTLLSARDTDDTPALLCAIKARADTWIANWATGLATVAPDVALDLLNPESTGGLPVLHRLFKYQSAGALRFWFDAVTGRLPPAAWSRVLEQPCARGCPALAHHFMNKAPMQPAFERAWIELLTRLPEDARVRVLQARDKDGCPAIVHAIWAGNAQGVRDWGRWLQVLAPEQRIALLQETDAKRASLLAQPREQPHQTLAGSGRAGGHTDHTGSAPGALRAWLDLIAG